MGSVYTESLNRLIEQFGKLPGVGPKTAERLAFYILKAKPTEAMELAHAIRDVKNKIKRCEICCNLSEGPRCQNSPYRPRCNDYRHRRGLINAR